MSGQGRAAVALVSFPGSGNTWVRGLLERATGICTGELAAAGHNIQEDSSACRISLHKYTVLLRTQPKKAKKRFMITCLYR